MKSFKSTLILLLIVAAVGGYIWFNERGPIAEQGSTVLLRTDPAQVQRVVFQDTAGKAIELQRSGDDWKVQETPKGKKPSTPAVIADEEAVENFLKEVQLLQSANVTSAQKEKLKEFGLDNPKSRVTLDGTEIQIGTSPSFDASRVYALINNQVALLPNTLSEAAAKPFAEWRDKAALRVDADETTKLVLQAPAAKATFVGEEKTDDQPRKWNLTQPVTAPADASTVNSFISQLPETTIGKFLAEEPKDLKQWGLDQPQVTIEATDDDGVSILKIGRKTQGGYAAQNSASPAIFEIPDTLFGLANRPLQDWRSKQILDFASEDIQQFQIKARGGSKTLQKKDEKWQLAGGQEDTAVHQAAFDVLLTLQGLNAEDFIDQPKPLSNYGLDKPDLEVSFNNKTIQLGSQGGKVYARSQGNTVYQVAGSTLDNLKNSLDVLFKK